MIGGALASDISRLTFHWPARCWDCTASSEELNPFGAAPPRRLRDLPPMDSGPGLPSTQLRSGRGRARTSGFRDEATAPHAPPSSASPF